MPVINPVFRQKLLERGIDPDQAEEVVGAQEVTDQQSPVVNPTPEVQQVAKVGPIKTAWNAINTGIVSPETITDLLARGVTPGGIGGNYLKDVPVIKQTLEGGGDVLSGLTSPLGLATLGISPTLRALRVAPRVIANVSRAIAAPFAAQAALQVPQGIGETYKTLTEQGPIEAIRPAIGTLGSGVIATLAGKHAITPTEIPVSPITGLRERHMASEPLVSSTVRTTSEAARLPINAIFANPQDIASEAGAAYVKPGAKPAEAPKGNIVQIQTTPSPTEIGRLKILAEEAKAKKVEQDRLTAIAKAEQKSMQTAEKVAESYKKEDAAIAEYFKIPETDWNKLSEEGKGELRNRFKTELEQAQLEARYVSEKAITKPATAGEVVVPKEELSKELQDRALAAETAKKVGIRGIVGKYSEEEGLPQESPSLQEVAAKRQEPLVEGAKKSNISLTPTIAWDEAFKRLGVMRNVKVDSSGKVFKSDGTEVSGEAFVRDGLKETLAKVNPDKASLDTWPHELTHPFLADLLENGTKAEQAFAKRGLAAIETNKAYQEWKAARDTKGASSTLYEYLTTLSGEDMVRRALRLDNKGIFKNWLSDFWSHIKDKFRKATPEDYARLMSRKLAYDIPFEQSFGKKGGVVPSASKEKEKQSLLSEDEEGLGESTSKPSSEDMNTYKTLKQQMNEMLDRGEFDKPEFRDVWQRLEDVKNKYGGASLENLSEGEEGLPTKYNATKAEDYVPEEQYLKGIRGYVDLKYNKLWKQKFSQDALDLQLKEDFIDFLDDKENLHLANQAMNIVDANDLSKINETVNVVRSWMHTHKSNLLESQEKLVDEFIRQYPEQKKYSELWKDYYKQNLETAREDLLDIDFSKDFDSGKLDREDYSEIGPSAEDIFNNWSKFRSTVFDQNPELGGYIDITKNYVGPSRTGGKYSINYQEGEGLPTKSPFDEMRDVVEKASEEKPEIRTIPTSKESEETASREQMKKALGNAGKYAEEGLPTQLRLASEEPLPDRNPAPREVIDLPKDSISEIESFSAPFGIKSLTPRFSRIAVELKNSPTGKLVSSTLNAMNGWMSRMEGQIGNKQLALLREHKLTKDEANTVVKYLWQLDDKGKSDININSKLQAFVDDYVKLIREPRLLQNQMGLKVQESKDFRVAGIKPNGYFPNMLKAEVAYEWANNPGSALAKKYDSLYLKHLTERGVTPEEAKSTLTEYKTALGYQVKPEVEFGALRKGEGKGLPFELIDDNLAHVMSRYGRRAARDLAFFKYIQKDPRMLKALNMYDQYGKRIPEGEQTNIENISTNPYVQKAMRSVFNVESAQLNETLQAANRLVANTVMGVGTAARNLASMPTFIAPYIKISQLPKMIETFSKMNESAVRAFENNAIRASFADYDAAGDFSSHPNPIIRRMSEAAYMLRKYQGRELSDKMEGWYYYTLGELLAKDNLASAKAGDKSSISFIKRFGDTVDGGAERLFKPDETVTQNDIGAIAKRFVDATRGTYSAEGLPSFAIEGPVAPLTQLSRFSIEKANTIWRDVAIPMSKGNYAPFLKLAFAGILSGTAIEKLNEILTGKRGPDPTIKEAINKRDTEAITAKLIGLLQLSSAAGIATDFMKVAMNSYQGKTTKFVNPISFPLYSVATDVIGKNTSDLFNAWHEGDDLFDIIPAYIQALITQVNQTYRYVDANIVRPEEAARKEKFRDLRVFQELEGDRSQQSSDLPDVIGGRKKKEFKRTSDLGRARELLPELISKAIDKAREKDGTINPEKLRDGLQSIKMNNYQTFPNPERNILSFEKFFQFLEQTQGHDAAVERLKDYVIQNVVNKAKTE